MVHLVMFDIDGTLVDSTEFDGRIHAEVIHEVLVVVVDRDWSTCPHVTDGGVPEELLRRHGIDDSDGARRAAVKQRFVARVRDYIEDDPHAVREIPGATALLAGLRAMAGCRLVLATSSDAHPRVEILRIAAHRALGDLAPRRRTYCGDGAWDRKACVELGWDFVAIGGKVAHAVAFASFADWAMILSVLGMHVEHSACPIARDRRP